MRLSNHKEDYLFYIIHNPFPVLQRALHEIYQREAIYISIHNQSL